MNLTDLTKKKRVCFTVKKLLIIQIVFGYTTINNAIGYAWTNLDKNMSFSSYLLQWRQKKNNHQCQKVANKKTRKNEFQINQPKTHKSQPLIEGNKSKSESCKKQMGVWVM